MNFRILFLLAYFNPDCVFRRDEIDSGDQPILNLFSTNLVRWPSMATLLQLRFFRYCFQYARLIAASSVIVDLPRSRVFPISTKVSPARHIFSIQNLSSSERCFLLFAIWIHCIQSSYLKVPRGFLSRFEGGVVGENGDQLEFLLYPPRFYVREIRN